jgi:hypothetical protein
MELKGKYKVRDSRIIIDDGHGREIPLITFIASLGIKIGDKIKISIVKVKEDDRSN